MATKLQAPTTETDEGRCFAGNLAWLLYRAHWALASELTAALEPLGVSARGFHVLKAALSGEHTQTELAEMVGLDKTTMVVTVDELERDGLAERRLSPHDRRAAHSWSRMDISTSSYQRPSCSTDSRWRPSSTNPAFS